MRKYIAHLRRATYFHTRPVGKGVTHYTLQSKEVCQMFPLDSLKKSIYLQLRRSYILFFSNHHIGIEPCDDYILNIVRLQVYYAYIPQHTIRTNKKQAVALWNTPI